MPAPSTRRSATPSGRVIALALALLVAAGCSGKEATSTSTTTGTAAPVETTTTTEVPLEGGKQIYVYSPAVGDCFDKRKVPGQNNKLTEVILMLECDQPHEFEVFAVVEYPAPDPKSTDPAAREFPEDDVLRKFAKTECPRHYEDYVGQRYELSKLEIAYVMPQKANWPSNRKIGCELYDVTGRKFTGTVRGSKS
jgi:hypothetical protein